MTTIFDNTAIAFQLKSDSELERAYFLFKLISKEPLVRIGTAVTNFALKANLPVERLIRASVFDHFCGGVSEEDCMPVIDKMFLKQVCSILDYSVEGKETDEQFDYAFEKTMNILDFVKEKDAIPFAVFKPTGYGRIDLFEKIGVGESLSPEETKEWEKVVFRFDETCKKANELGVSLLIDAEESWMQGAADDLVEEMMRRYNKETVIIYNTLQLYRWDRVTYLKKLHQRALKDGFKIGMKLVRGAYMEKEAVHAEEKGQKSPICISKTATDENYSKGVAYMMENLDVMSIFAGTHNEQSSFDLMELMKKHNIATDDKRVWFGQLYGMSDHISYNLAANNYNVAKYLPYGPVKDVMPYLIRRAEENTSVAGQTGRELTLLKTERKRRKL